MTVGSVVELLVLLLIAASIIAVITSHLRIPYTIALVFGGFAIDLFDVPLAELVGEGGGVLTPEIVFVIFLPGLLFESGININVAHLRSNLTPILVLAIAGVLVSTVLTGYVVHWAIGMPLLIALVFGALISATDPISVLALFKDMGVHKRLAVIVEGESLFNDGTAVVVFQIVLAAVATGTTSAASGVSTFITVALGGAALGGILGYAASKITEQIDDPRIEITLTTILAYGSYILAEELHVSGVIAVVVAGLMVGNYGAKFGMSARTRVALWSFWEYFAFVINSLVFLLIGIEVHVVDMAAAWASILIAVATVLFARVISVYGLSLLSNRISEPISLRWQHVLVWGGLHGGVSMALVLSLAPDFPFRAQLLAMTFGVVTFSIVGQGLTMKPLIRRLGLQLVKEERYDALKVRRMALSAAKSELEDLLEDDLITLQVHRQLVEQLEQESAQLSQELVESQEQHPGLVDDELRMARFRLQEARKSAVQKATTDGFVSIEAGDRMLAEIDREIDSLRGGH